MNAVFPWSFSSLTKFETCPKQYYHVKIARDVVEAPSDATVWGSTLHKHFEERLRSNTPLPAMLAQYEPMLAKIAATPGQKLVEQQMCVRSDLTPTTWTDKEAWCRGVVDVGVVSEKDAVLLDYKTGKRKPESSQLKLFAALAFAHYQSVDTVFTGFVWLKHNKIDTQKYARSDAIKIWQEFSGRVYRLELAERKGDFPPKPSGLCAKYCPVPRSKCQFSGRT